MENTVIPEDDFLKPNLDPDRAEALFVKDALAQLGLQHENDVYDDMVGEVKRRATVDAIEQVNQARLKQAMSTSQMPAHSHCIGSGVAASPPNRIPSLATQPYAKPDALIWARETPNSTLAIRQAALRLAIEHAKGRNHSTSGVMALAAEFENYLIGAVDKPVITA